MISDGIVIKLERMRQDCFDDELFINAWFDERRAIGVDAAEVKVHIKLLAAVVERRRMLRALEALAGEHWRDWESHRCTTCDAPYPCRHLRLIAEGLGVR